MKNGDLSFLMLNEMNEEHHRRIDHEPVPVESGEGADYLRRDARLLGLIPTKTGPVRHCNGIPNRKTRGRQTKSW